MKIAIYYIASLVIGGMLFLVAARAKEKEKKFIEYLCYLGIIAEILILI